MTFSKPRRSLAALPVLGLLAVSATAVAQVAPVPKERPTDTVVTTKKWTLKPNTTQTFSVRIAGITQAAGSAVLNTCWGFDIQGKGINLPVGGLSPYGKTWPEHGKEDTDDGGVPGAERQPDGSFVIPASEAKIGAYQLKRGALCHRVGWRPVTDTDASTARAARRSRRAHAGGVQIQFGGLHNLVDGAELVLRVKTGSIPAGTTVTAHASATHYVPVG